MRIIDRLRKSEKPCFSFEFFPPKSEPGVQELYATIEDMKALAPDFVSVTCGAGGSTQQRTLELVAGIKIRTQIEAMAHLTCVAHGRQKLREILHSLVSAGVENVLVLRGDTPRDVISFSPPTDGFAHASDLVKFIREENFSFCLGGACYPETHLESPSRKDDMVQTLQKVNSGLEFLVTQLFFDNAFYFDFVDRATKAGITCPIVPGIMPITNFVQIERFTRMCGATIPTRLRLRLERFAHEPEAIFQIGVEQAIEQCQELVAAKVAGIHFYTLNRSTASRLVLHALRP